MKLSLNPHSLRWKRNKMKLNQLTTHSPITLLPLLSLAGLLLVVGCLTSLSQQAASPKRVLVVTTTVGFRHSSIPTAEKILGELGQKSGAFTVDYARVDVYEPQFKGADGKPDKAKYEPVVAAVLAEKMSAAALKNYDAVIFANTTGDLPLPDKEAFLNWIKSGKGFVGIHSAADTFDKTADYPGYPPYIEMLGAAFKTHGAQVEVEAINQDKACAACRHLPEKWIVFDEIYQFQSFDRAKVHGLLTLDKHPNNKTPGDYPIAWIKEYGQGRVFYTSLGHREDMWDPNAKGEHKNSPEIAAAYQEHILGGIKWALGLENGNAKP
jgi:type 1 glutamine amidotransferase